MGVDHRVCKDGLEPPAGQHYAAGLPTPDRRPTRPEAAVRPFTALVLVVLLAALVIATVVQLLSARAM